MFLWWAQNIHVSVMIPPTNTFFYFFREKKNKALVRFNSHSYFPSLIVEMEPPNENDAAETRQIKANGSFDEAVDDQSTSSSTVTFCFPDTSPEVSSPAHTLRRRSIPDAGASDPKARFREKRENVARQSKEKSEDGKRVDSAGSARGANSAGELGDEEVSSSWLVFVASLVIKAVGFQFNLIFKFVSYPVWILYNCYMLVVDPFGFTRRFRGFFLRKVGSLCKWSLGKVSPFVGDWFKDQKVAWNLLLQCGWGFFWSVYVGIILCGLLVVSVMLSGFFMRCLVEQPLRLKEDLNFDYTKNSPVAYMPVKSCSGVDCGVNCEMKVVDGRSARSWLVRPNQKLQAGISLTLPESEYNRNLGIFQVRVEFLSADGKTVASKTHPCMLKFKSQPVRVLTTFLKAAPLVTGYVSESQTVQFNIRGLTEGQVPTSCVKVTIEQRAEFRPGAGIPEIYDASLTLEADIPFFKRVIWYWRKTIFVWTTVVFFLMQFLFTLVCCRGLIIPRTRTGRRT